MFYLIVGFRNIMKNFRRSLITMISIVIGMIACLLIHGFFNWNINELKESIIRNGAGHYQLYAAGFSKFGSDDPYNYLIQDPAPILKELRRIPEIELVTTRMPFSGIIASGDKSAVISGEAGYPENERKLNSYSGLIRGRGLSSKRPNCVIIGDGVARKISAKIGTTITLVGNMKDGGINAVDLELAGITHQGNTDLDNISIAAPLGVIQNLLNINDGVQKILVILKNTKDAFKVLPRIKEISQKYRLEYKGWEELAEFYQQMKLMYDVVFNIIMIIVLAISAFTISNTVNMNLNDRFREIGTIRALGTKRVQVALIFIIESFLTGFIGGLIGIFLSYLFIGLVELIGGFPVIIESAGQARLIRIFFRPEPTALVVCIGLFSLVAMLASLVPSRRASKISISHALRWI
jgi:putative ABC transport system permease protein